MYDDYQYKSLTREIESLRKEVTRLREERDKIWEECREAVWMKRELSRILKAFLQESE